MNKEEAFDIPEKIFTYINGDNSIKIEISVLNNHLLNLTYPKYQKQILMSNAEAAIFWLLKTAKEQHNG